MCLYLQELQQEVSSLLLFRQAVLKALPHLQSKDFSVGGVGGGNINNNNNNNNNNSPLSSKVSHAAATWTRRHHQSQQQQQQQQQFEQLQQHLEQHLEQQQDAAVASGTSGASGAATSSTHNGVADSGFSTEASNSNTSPRSSRFETAAPPCCNPADAPDVGHDPPVEKQLAQHLERVQQRMARLRKDESRLLTLLQPNRSADARDARDARDTDELSRLLEEIRIRSRAIMDVKAAPVAAATGAAAVGVAAAERDAHDELQEARRRCQLAAKDVEWSRKRADESDRETASPRRRRPAAAEQEAAGAHVTHDDQSPGGTLSGIKKRVSFQDGVATVSLYPLAPAPAPPPPLCVSPPPAGASVSPASALSLKGGIAAGIAAGIGIGGAMAGGGRPSREKVAAVLRTSNPIQLQRHLLRALVDNQVGVARWLIDWQSSSSVPIGSRRFASHRFRSHGVRMASAFRPPLTRFLLLLLLLLFHFFFLFLFLVSLCTFLYLFLF